MELSSSQMRAVERKFDSFCKKLLINELRDCLRYLKYRRTHEVLFSEMSQKQA